MSINFGQFPTPRLPIQTGDFVVGYQLIGSVPTLAQYTMTQLFTGAFPGGVLPVSNGGTGLSTVPAGDLLVGTGTNTMNFIIPGTAGAMLISQGTSVSPLFANNPVITGGSVDGAPVGATTRSTGAFTSLSATSGLNSTAVGNTTPSTGAFTTLAASGVTTLSNGTSSSGSGSGALVVTGGVGVGNNLFAAGSVVAGGGLTGTIGAGTPNTGSFTTVLASGTITPSQTAGIVGTTTNNNANAGSVGEFISSTVLQGSAVPLTTFTTTNVTSISLTAGDWDISGNVVYQGVGATFTDIQGSISTVSATFPTLPGNGAYYQIATNFLAGATLGCPVGTVRMSLATTTTVFLLAIGGFTPAGTATAYGFIGARRRR